MLRSGMIQGFCDYCKTEGDYNDMKKYRWYEDTLYGFCSRNCAVKFANKNDMYRATIQEWASAQ
jgi:hypothetical protein